jgi:hypothetical protein
VKFAAANGTTYETTDNTFTTRATFSEQVAAFEDYTQGYEVFVPTGGASSS